MLSCHQKKQEIINIISHGWTHDGMAITNRLRLTGVLLKGNSSRSGSGPSGCAKIALPGEWAERAVAALQFFVGVGWH